MASSKRSEQLCLFSGGIGTRGRGAWRLDEKTFGERRAGAPRLHPVPRPPCERAEEDDGDLNPPNPLGLERPEVIDRDGGKDPPDHERNGDETDDRQNPSVENEAKEELHRFGDVVAVEGVAALPAGT